MKIDEDGDLNVNIEFFKEFYKKLDWEKFNERIEGYSTDEEIINDFKKTYNSFANYTHEFYLDGKTSFNGEIYDD